METKDENSIIKDFSFKINDINKNEFLVKVVLEKKKIVFNAYSIDSIKSAIFTKSMEIKDFHEAKDCTYFMMFRSIEGIYDELTQLELATNSTISVENEKAFLEIKIQIRNNEHKLIISLDGEKMKIEEVVDKLCDKIKEVIDLKEKIKEVIDLKEKVKEVINLKEKINQIYNTIGLSEQIINNNIKNKKNLILKYSGLKDSTIFQTISDVNVINNGISSKLSKNIKNFKLLYKASIDGDGASKFHEKCDNHYSTVTIVQTNTGRRFGGFTTQLWNHTGNYRNDGSSFVFSIDNRECYFYNSGYSIYCNNSHGPTFGGNDFNLRSFCLNGESNCNSSQSGSYNYNSRTFALTGAYNFVPIDYEVYEIEFY